MGPTENNNDDDDDDVASAAVRRAMAELGPSLSRLGVRLELGPAIADTVRRVVTEALHAKTKPEVEEHLCQQLTSLENIVDEMTLARNDDDDGAKGGACVERVATEWRPQLTTRRRR